MSASTSRVTIQQLKPVIRSLPASPLSENVQFADALEAIAERALATSSVSAASAGQTQAQTQAQPISPMDALKVAGHQRTLIQMRDSIARIRSGAALRDYPLTKTTLSPPNDPYFYTRIRNGFHNAAKGIQRPWWKIFFGVKGQE